MGLILSGSIHDQKAHFGLKNYNGTQNNFYANLIFQTNFDHHHKVSGGLSFNHDVFDEEVKIYQTDGSLQNFNPYLKKNLFLVYLQNIPTTSMINLWF